MTSELTFHEIVSLDDTLYDAWLDLYQAAFPLNEQMRVSDHNRVLRGKANGKSGDRHLLAALDEQGKLVAMARYDVVRDRHAAALWYMAVVPEARSQGIGSRLYRHIRERLQAEEAEVWALVFEVEDPEIVDGAHERELAHRRIQFYQRNRARLLCGIQYTQSVGWQPEVPMRLMVHEFRPLGLEAVYRLAECLFEDAMQQTGPLSLE